MFSKSRGPSAGQSVFWERGSLDLLSCGLRCGSSSGLVRPVFIDPSSRPSRGAKPRGADDTRLPQGWPRQAGSRGGGEIKAGSTSRGARDTSHDNRDQAGTSLRSVLVSSLVQRGASAGAEYRGIRQMFPYWCNETKTSRAAGQRSPWSPRRRHRQCLWQSKTTFSQDSIY